MSSRTMTQHVPHHAIVEEHIESARFQIMTLKRVLDADNPAPAHAESCVSACIDQLLQAVTGALFGFNSLLPDSLPAQRLTRKNLRDQFSAVTAESAVLQVVDDAARPGEGWLWSLEQKHDGAAFRQLLTAAGPSSSPVFTLVKDPFNPNTGVEQRGLIAYLDRAVRDVEQLIARIDSLANDDVMSYREAQRRQARRLI